MKGSSIRVSREDPAKPGQKPPLNYGRGTSRGHRRKGTKEVQGDVVLSAVEVSKHAQEQ